MDKLIKIFNRSAISFTTFILVLSITGFLLLEDIDYNNGISSMFTVPQSIRYITVFEGILASLSISAWNVLVEEFKGYQNMMFIWKFVLHFIVSIVIMVVFIAIFDWFPFTSMKAWLLFFVSFIITMGSAISIMAYRAKKEDKVYQDLFEEYKRNHKGE